MRNNGHWRTAEPELHELISCVAQFVAQPKERIQWMIQFDEYTIEVKRSDELRRSWAQSRRGYFEEQIFAPGNEHLRDLTIPHADLETDIYCLTPSQLRQKPIPNDLLTATYVDRILDSTGQLVRKCSIDGAFQVCAWVPSKLKTFDARLLTHDPLPPDEIGREYTSPEVCHALTVLHDADGSFGRIVPQTDSRYSLQGLGFDELSVKATASSDWVPGLKFWFLKLQDEITTHVNADGVRPELIEGCGETAHADGASGISWLTVSEAARASGLETYQITRAANGGLVAARGNGRGRRIDAASLALWLLKRAEAPLDYESDKAIRRKLDRAEVD